MYAASAVNADSPMSGADRADGAGGTAALPASGAIAPVVMEPQRGQRRRRANVLRDYSNLLVPKSQMVQGWPAEQAAVQWFVHLDEFNTLKPYSRSIASMLETAHRLGRSECVIFLRNRDYTVRFGSPMIQESMDTGRLRHVMRGFFPRRPESGHSETGLPVEEDSDA